MRRHNCCAPIERSADPRSKERIELSRRALPDVEKWRGAMGIANSAEIPHIGFLSPVAPSSPSALKPGTLRYQFGNIARRALGHAAAVAAATNSAGARMTHVVTESCINCRYTA